MNISQATKLYERWLAEHITLIAPDVIAKHQAMAQGVFPFMRATYYRWVQIFPDNCPEIANAPSVLAVGDLHVENFGTWRDNEGRLVWGINDFDEACPMPYTNDLVRLAASARLAIGADKAAFTAKQACEAILRGYTDGLEAGGSPFVLEEKHNRLRDMALGELRDPARFWQKMSKLQDVNEPIPEPAKDALERLLPEAGLYHRIALRTAGLGSRGHQRFVAIADWRGGKIAREVKALAFPASVWAARTEPVTNNWYQEIVSCAVRCPDPFVRVSGNWLARRLAPDCSRIELDTLLSYKDLLELLKAMGWETANIHLASKDMIDGVKQDLAKRPDGWLQAASKQMVRLLESDWEDWKKNWKAEFTAPAA
jgi:Uncharacterized protein conserved in bacteria (DUF2252)